MKHGFYESLWRAPWLAAVLILLAAPLSAARLGPKTLAAFEDYLREKEERLERRLADEQSFLWALESAEREQGLRRGEIYVKPRSGKGEVDIHRGLVHDWVGAVFIPGVTLEETLSTIQDYDNHKPCQGRSKFGPLRRSKSRPVGEGVAVFVGRLERSLRSPFRAAQA